MVANNLIPVSRLLDSIFYLIIAILMYFYLRYNLAYGLDDSYITYRYAQNLNFGIGLVFNEGERYFGSTAMGMAILLAMLSWLVDAIAALWLEALPWPVGAQIPVIAHWISALAIAMIVILSYRIAIKHLSIYWAGLVSTIFALYLFPADYMNAAAGHETYLFLAFLSLSAYVLIYKESAFWSGFILGITTTFRPDALLYAVILMGWLALRWVRSGLAYADQQKLIKFLVGYGVVSIIWFGFCASYFGRIFPETLTAKRAQPFLGHWLNFELKVALGEAVRRIRPLVVSLMLVLIFGALIVRIASQKTSQAWASFFNNPLAAFSSSLLLFGLGQLVFYSLLKVSFWFWYAFPFCIILALTGFLSAIDLIHEVKRNEPRKIKRLRIMLLGVAGCLFLVNLNFFRYSVYQIMIGNSTNLQLTSYDSIIEYIKLQEPKGTSIATAEPGVLGFKLGPRYRIIDELGLVSPGVAKNIITGNLDFPFEAYKPEYVIVSWAGKYSPHERLWFPNLYELIGEFKHPYWDLHVKRGAYLYKNKV